MSFLKIESKSNSQFLSKSLPGTQSSLKPSWRDTQSPTMNKIGIFSIRSSPDWEQSLFSRCWWSSTSYTLTVTVAIFSSKSKKLQRIFFQSPLTSSNKNITMWNRKYINRQSPQISLGNSTGRASKKKPKSARFKSNKIRKSPST